MAIPAQLCGLAKGCSRMTGQQMATDFDDIRPYRDDEVATVIARLVDDGEFVDTLARMKFARLLRWVPWLIRPLVHKRLRREFGHLKNVQELQMLIGGLLERLLERVANGVAVAGLDKLSADQPYLFMSNHRDIAMDPAMVDLALNGRGMDTLRIAIGDNLLTKSFTSDLMRLNKSFIVKRSITGRKEKLAALKQLSAYIQHSLEIDKQSVWIAQREGRAKDGVDSTEAAVLKMLVLNRLREESFGEAFARCRVVPVAVSYEWDPCDAAKARELYAMRNQGSYVKGEHEDIDSIYQGIMGHKGHIAVVFGQQMSEVFADADTAAAAIDQQIIKNYRLQATHLIAYEQVFGENAATAKWKQELGAVDWPAKRAAMTTRLAKAPEQHRDIMLAAYANPVRRRLELTG